jgi:hypothetical protein
MSIFHPRAASRPHVAPDALRPARSPRVCARRAAIALTGALTLVLGLGGCSDDGNDAASAATTFSVGGSVAGLTTAGLVLANGSDTASLAAGATSFTFSTALATGSNYAVSVQTQPANATCVVSGGIGTVGTAAVPGVAVTCSPLAFTVGGSVTGLSATGLVLANGTYTVAVASGATGFTLPTPVAQGASYTVTVQTQPAGEHCSLTSSTGTIAGANVTNVAVACAAVSHSLGGTISGLPSTGLVLANGSDTVSPAAGALSFTFATPVAEGGAYAVSVQTQPSGATCSVGSGTGTMGTSNVVSVQVTCAANAYHLGGTIAGLTAGGLILANGTDTVSPAANATNFTFPLSVSFGGNYSVTVTQQPTGLTCSVAGMFPATMGAGDVTNVAVTCATAAAYAPLAGHEVCTPPNSQDGTGSGASIPGATAIAFDAAGNVYTTSGFSVHKITPAGVATTLAGSDGGGQPGQVDGTGAAAGFSANVNALAADSAGNIYVGDQYMVRKITQAGVVTTLAGQVGSGFGNGTGAAAAFGIINGIAVDSAGNVYVTGYNNAALRKISPAGAVTTLAGSNPAIGPTPGFVDGLGGAARFAGPWGMAIDGAGNLFVADAFNYAIRKVTPAGQVTTLAGGGPAASGYLDATGNAARFNSPDSLSIDAAGNLYVNDANGSAVRKVTPGGVVTTVAYSDSFTANTGQPAPGGALHIVTLQYATHVANSAGVLYFPSGCAIEKAGP